MSTDLQAPCVTDVSGDLQVIARTPAEMQQARASLAEWMRRKVDIQQKDADELAEEVRVAEWSNFKSTTLKRHHSIAVKRVAFYEKMVAALEAGYCIVPNFPVELIAIRTTRESPEQNMHHWRNEAAKDIKTDKPELGEGQFVSAVAETNSMTQYVYDDKGMAVKDAQGNWKSKTVFYPSEYDTEVEFPVSIARPAVMTATAEAMALKCFDEIGVLGVPARQTARGRKADPIVVGRIIDPRSTKASPRFVTFMLAWYIDTKEL